MNDDILKKSISELLSGAKRNLFCKKNLYHNLIAKFCLVQLKTGRRKSKFEDKNEITIR